MCTAVTGFAHAYRIPWERVFSPIFIHPPPVTPPKTSPQTGHVSVDFIRTYTPKQYINIYNVCYVYSNFYAPDLHCVYVCVFFPIRRNRYWTWQANNGRNFYKKTTP